MWEMVDNMMPQVRRMMPRRNRGMNTATAMMIGAGVGIAAWELMRRNNAAGMVMNAINNQNRNENLLGDIDSNTITQMASQAMDAIKQ